MLRRGATSRSIMTRLSGPFGEMKKTGEQDDYGIDGLNLMNATSLTYRRAERRIKSRLQGPFPALVRGLNANGETFETETMLDDLSAGGLHLRLRQPVSLGVVIFLVARLTHGGMPEVCVPRVALRSLVLRSEQQVDGSFGVAAAILHHRFLDP